MLAEPNGKPPQLPLAVWIIGLIMAACLIGLTHDATNLESSRDFSVERGAGLNQHEKFEKDVNAAPIRRKAAFLTLIAIGAYCALTARRNFAVHVGPVLLLIVACLVLVVASLIWSVERGETAREIVRILAYVGVSATLAMRLRPREICFVLAMMALGSVICACGLELVTGHFQPWRSGYRLHGSIHSNVLASHAMVAALVAVAFLNQTRWPWLLRTVLVAMVAVILLTKTRGALATTLVGMSGIYLVGRPLRSTAIVVSLLCLMVCTTMLALVLAGPEIQARVQRAVLLGRSEGATTLTGRLPLWETLWRESREHRWLGFGYGAFWTIDRMEELNDELEWYPGHAHSAYLQTVLDVGMVGALLVIALVFASLKRSAQLAQYSSDEAFKFVFGFLIAGLVDGLVEVSFVYPRGLGLFVATVLFSLVMVHAPLGYAARAAKRANNPGNLAPACRNNHHRLSFQ